MPEKDSTGSTFNHGDFTPANAFFWSSLDLSHFAGTDLGSTPYRIELTDAAGKKATGYLAGVAAGETLGGETVTGWTNLGPPYDFETLTSVGGDITLAIESTGMGVAYSNQTAYTALALFKIVNNMTINSGNLPVLYFGYGNPNILEPPTLIRIGAQSAGENIYYCVNPSTYNRIQYNSSNPSIFSCTNSIKRVSDPPATAIHIVSSLNGTTRNWASIESGFNPNTITSWAIYNSYTIRQKIITTLDARLKAILQANGYATDVGKNVYDWRTEGLSEDFLPALIYRDVSCETEITGLEVFTHRLKIQIEVSATGSTSMAEIRKMLADINKAIGVDLSWGDLALLTERIGDESISETEENKFSGCQTIVMITFRTRGWDDYTKI